VLVDDHEEGASDEGIDKEAWAIGVFVTVIIVGDFMTSYSDAFFSLF